jgi:catechol 2,3-dioxygenase-like lactoylglutathione lyase family enzyme
MSRQRPLRWPFSDPLMRLNQITAPASDLAASIAFYETLGLKLIVRSAHYARFDLPEGEATFSLHVVEGGIPRANAPQLYFEVRDLDLTFRDLQTAGVVFDAPPTDQPWLWREAWLRDPAGNALCLYHAGEHRRFPPWRIDVPATPADLHIVIRDNARWAIAKLTDDQDWRVLQAEYADFMTSLGPFDLLGLLGQMEWHWPDVLRRHEAAIRAFAAGGERRLSF